jgi:two-component system, LuxR family, sensor kinase FixL
MKPVSTPENENIIKDLFSEATKLTKQEFNNLQISIDTRIDGSIPNLFANSVQLQQILLNLIRNSAEAMENQSSNKQIALECNLNQSLAFEFCAKDTGPGIPNNVSEDLITHHDTNKPDGLGMALFICNFIISSHGRALWHDASSLEGACIRFQIPIDAESVLI